MFKFQLPIYNINVIVNGDGTGTLSSSLRTEICGETAESIRRDAAIDALEGLILAMACAGLDIQQQPFIDSIMVVIKKIEGMQ